MPESREFTTKNSIYNILDDISEGDELNIRFTNGYYCNGFETVYTENIDDSIITVLSNNGNWPAFIIISNDNSFNSIVYIPEETSDGVKLKKKGECRCVQVERYGFQVSDTKSKEQFIDWKNKNMLGKIYN